MNPDHKFPLTPTPLPEERGTASVEASDGKSQIANGKNPSVPWNIYFRVTLPDAIQSGLVDTINRARGTKISPGQFLADCRARARDEEIFQQSYMCNPMGTAANHIVEWSCIERCRSDYKIERVHLEAEEVRRRFGDFSPGGEGERERRIQAFLNKSFDEVLEARNRADKSKGLNKSTQFRLGFDVAASGEGDLCAIYIDEAVGDQLWLRALFTCRTEDWHFIKTVLFHFLKQLPNVRGAGDSSGLGRQICWEAAEQFSSRFLSVSFGSKKHDLGFALMNQLSVAEKRFPKSQADIAADYFALRKAHNGTKWGFSEGRNTLNAASHCDIAWAGALATHAHTEEPCQVGAALIYENGWFDGKEFHPFADTEEKMKKAEAEMLWSDDPRIWHRLG
jgi:phage FluMu gp28-like protein